MEADEINEGLAEYMGWRVIGGALLNEWPITQEEPYVIGAVFTDSLDACEKVADKLGVWNFNCYSIRDGEWFSGIHVELDRRTRGEGPTRSHALAAALWAAVRETNHG